MMLHKSKGRYRFQNKATFCLQYGLNPIILAYLKQLVSNKDKDCFGVPQYYMQKQARIQGFENYWDNTADVDAKAAFELRMKDLEELLWVFSQTSDDEPDMEDYGLSYEWSDSPAKDGYKRYKRVETKPNAFENYTKACEEWQDRIDKGYALFGQIYGTLQW